MMHQLVKSYLLKHSQVSIQGMGEWKVTYEPSHIHPVLQTFTVPGNYVHFTLNEGVITTPEFIAEAARTWQVSAEEAEAKVNAWVQEVKDTLSRHSVYEWGSMGRMVNNGIGKMEFEPAMDPDFSPESFGLENFEIANIHIKPATDAAEHIPAAATAAKMADEAPEAAAEEEEEEEVENATPAATLPAEACAEADTQEADHDKEEENTSHSSHKLTFLLIILAILLILVGVMGVLYVKSPQTIAVYKHKAGLWMESIPFLHYQSHKDTVPSIFSEDIDEEVIDEYDEDAPDKLIFDDNFIANTTEYISSDDEDEYTEYVENTEPSTPEVKVAPVAQKVTAKTTTTKTETAKPTATPAKATSTGKQVAAKTEVAKNVSNKPATKSASTQTVKVEAVKSTKTAATTQTVKPAAVAKESATAVQKPATTTAAKPVTGAYYIILGSFQSEANAEAYLKDMNSKYGNAHNLGTGKSSGLYMIGIGPYTQEEASQKMANEGIKGWMLKK